MTKESCIEEAKRRDKWDRRACYVRLRENELVKEKNMDKSSATKRASDEWAEYQSEEMNKIIDEI